MHTVAVLALPYVVPFDLSTPLEVFGRARQADGSELYRVLVCAERPQVPGAVLTVTAPYGLDTLAAADTVIVPGCDFGAPPPTPAVLGALRAAASRGTRIASICGGAFVLAAAALLDGLAATTHWLGAEALARDFPAVRVKPSVLYVDNGQILTSAGAAAGIDLCLHLVRRDYGSAVAAEVARLSVVPLEREGGQAQFIVHELPPVPRGSLLEPMLAWVEDNLAEPLTVQQMAARCGMSERTFNRRFREQTGTTPLQWLLRARVRRAQYLLEHTGHGIDRIAGQAGFGSPTAFRERFRRVTGVAPHAYRTSFRTAAVQPAEMGGTR